MSLTSAQPTFEDVKDSYELLRGRKQDIPFDDYHVDALDSTEIDFNIHDYLGRIRAKSFPKWRFKGGDVKVYSSKPIQVVMTRDDNTVYAENESLDIYASGNSEQEAIEDFCQHVIYFYQHYKQLDWDKVTGHAKELKEIYEQLFHEEA